MTATSFEIKGEKELKKNEARDAAISCATNEAAVSRKNSNDLRSKEDKAAPDQGEQTQRDKIERVSVKKPLYYWHER